MVALRVGAVFDGVVHLEAAIILCAEVFYVSQNHAGTVRPGLALQLHGRHLSAAQFGFNDVAGLRDFDWGFLDLQLAPDRKSTRLNSSHTVISYAVFCLKKKRAISGANAVIEPENQRV